MEIDAIHSGERDGGQSKKIITDAGGSMGKWFILGLAVLMTGCATRPIPAEQADPVPVKRAMEYQSIPEGEHGQLLVTRDTGMMGVACTTVLFIDAEPVAEIRAGETVRFYVPTGEIILGANTKEAICGGGLLEREIDIEAGKTERYRVSMNTSMSMDLSPTAY